MLNGTICTHTESMINCYRYISVENIKSMSVSNIFTHAKGMNSYPASQVQNQMSVLKS